ncbi:protein RD3-like [Sturnira hondurensis]|uniref:protein RD3-like n=1 Tax=Sturnira hondurensis TaxID=192404 RepID=UPI00187ADF6E|nr:protein RD3-like [Sturnira hondurensis]
MPLFGWTKGPKHSPYRPTHCPSPEGAARTLLRELRRQLEEQERALQEMENGPEGKSTGVDCRWLRNHQVPRTGIPAARQRQLEALCSQVQPHQTGAILRRFREVLAENDVLPWEIVYLFKQVLEDTLGRKGGQPGGPSPPACPGDHARSTDRGEIPTVSSYVDRNREGRLPALACRAWDLPCDPLPVGLPGPEAFGGPPPGQGTRHRE